MVDFDLLVNGPVSATLGETMTYQPATGSAYDVQAIFAEPYRRQEFGDDGQAKWVTTAPSAGMQLSQLQAAIAKNDKLTRQKTGVTYRISEPQPNGLGWVNLTLKESA